MLEKKTVFSKQQMIRCDNQSIRRQRARREIEKQYKQWTAKQNRPVAGDKVSGCLKRGINRVYTVYKEEKNRTQVKTSEDTAVPDCLGCEKKER